VAECHSAAEAAQAVSQARPDVVTVSVNLPDGDGLQLARELRDRYDSLGIVILTSRGEDDVLFRALETGVSAFVDETAPVEEVLGAIRHSAVAASSFTASGLATALTRRRESRERLALSPREVEVLRLLCDGLSVPAIAARMFISYSTAKTYVARLYQKLGAANRAQALMVAVQHGLISCEKAASGTIPRPAAGFPVAGPPVAGHPVAGHPVAGHPVAGHPAAGLPATSSRSALPEAGRSSRLAVAAPAGPELHR